MKFEVPKELVDKVYKLVEDVRASGKIRKGTNESTKSVERAEARLVVIASDTNPPEIVAHIPMLCDEKKIPYVWIPAKADLGAAAGLPVGTSAVAIVHPGEAAKKLDTIVKQIKTLTGKKEEPKKEEKKPAPKKEEKPAPKKEEPKPASSEEPKKKPQPEAKASVAPTK